MKGVLLIRHPCQCSAVRCGAVRCGAVRCSAVRCGAVRCGAVRCGAVRCGAVRCSATYNMEPPHANGTRARRPCGEGGPPETHQTPPR